MDEGDTGSGRREEGSGLTHVSKPANNNDDDNDSNDNDNTTTTTTATTP